MSIVLAICAAWYLWLAPPVHRVLPLADDTFRDCAYVENILAGRLLQDPSTADLPYWYAPGGPLLCAAVCRLTGLSPVEVYSSSVLWVNVLIPVCIFLLVRMCWGRAVGVAAVLLVWVGSRWWQTHLAMPMPSVIW